MLKLLLRSLRVKLEKVRQDLSLLRDRQIIEFENI
jgi:hypothetical protein